jgi:tRNA/tmRNA/rRNA uracil-C5-methylase (TrmA/RlmC/RlmD family)
VVAGDWSAEFEVSGRGFWQVHPGAASTFVGAVLDVLSPEPGQRVLDLYAGVGLFAAALAESVGPGGAVLAVESDHVAMECAAANLARWPWVETRVGRVDRVLGSLVRQRVTADLAVLDPPRSGAGRRAIADLAALAPQRLAYVACDPAALARDTAYLQDAGYRLRSLRAFDAFPMTHHVECVALFTP